MKYLIALALLSASLAAYGSNQQEAQQFADGDLEPFRTIEPEKLSFRSLNQLPSPGEREKKTIVDDDEDTIGPVLPPISSYSLSNTNATIQMEPPPDNHPCFGYFIEVGYLICDTDDYKAMNYLYSMRRDYTFEPFYAGFLKGIKETRAQLSGNSYDLAATYKDYLDKIGIQARFKKGRVKVSAAVAKKWVGVTSAVVAEDIFQSAGLNVTSYRSSYTTGGSIEIDHVWVEAYIDGRWKQLDPSKSFYRAINSGNDTFEKKRIGSGSSLLNSIKNDSMYSSQSGLMSINNDIFGEYTYDLEDNRELYLKNKSVSDIENIYSFRKKYQATDNELNNFYSVKSSTTYSSANFDVNKIKVTLNGYTATFDIRNFEGKRLNVAYRPATSSAQRAISNNNGVLGLPYKSIDLFVVLRLDGEPLMEGGKLKLGEYHDLKIEFKRSGLILDTVTHDGLTTGGLYAIILDTQKISPSRMSESQEKLESSIADINSETMFDHNVSGELLNQIGLQYFHQLNNVANGLSSSSNTIMFHTVSEALVSLDLTARNLNGTLVMAMGSQGIDAPVNVWGTYPTQTDYTDFSTAPNTISLGFASSEFEETVFNRYTGWPAYSTTTHLRYAADNGESVYIIDSNNSSKISRLSVTDKITNAIQNAVTQGKVVIAPRKFQSINGHRGYGFAIIDPETGAGGFYIENGDAGGKLTFPAMSTNEAVSALIEIGATIRDAAIDGIVYGSYNANVYDEQYLMWTSVGTAFASDFVLIGDFRNIYMEGAALFDGNGSLGNLTIAAVGLMPIGDLANAARYSDNFYALKELSGLKGALTSRNINADSVLGNLAKDSSLSRFYSSSGLFNGVVSESVKLNQSFTNVFIKNSNKFISDLGLSASNLNKAVLGEKAAIKWAQKKGYSCVFCDGNPSANGIDAIFKDGDTYIISEAKFSGSSSNVGLGLLSKSSSSGRQLSYKWIQNSIESTPHLSSKTRNKLRAALAQGKVRTQLFVVKGKQRGNTVTNRLTRSPDVGTSGTLSISDIVIVELDL